MTALPNDDNVFPIATAKLSAQFVIVTPTMAKEWLRFNDNNRNMRGPNVAMYARDIRTDRWIVTGQAIQFDRDGVMIDGQHRLMAIIKADKPVMLLVVRGLDPRAKSVIDAGAKRSAADALKFAGVTNYTLVASLCRLCLIIDSGATDATTGKKFSNSEIEEYREQHPETEVAASAINSYKARLPMQPSVTAYCWMRLSEVDTEACVEFFTSMADSATDGRGDPRKTLLDKLRDHKDKKVKDSAAKQIQYVFRAWNYWRAGKSLLILKDVRDEDIPEPH